jgi:hypothetical protein
MNSTFTSCSESLVYTMSILWLGLIASLVFTHLVRRILFRIMRMVPDEFHGLLLNTQILLLGIVDSVLCIILLFMSNCNPYLVIFNLMLIHLFLIVFSCFEIWKERHIHNIHSFPTQLKATTIIQSISYVFIYIFILLVSP